MNNFRRNITNAFGEKGDKWLKKLPKIIKNLSQIWNLTNITPVKNLSWNYVADSILNNESVILKIGIDNKVILDEMNCLKFWNGVGAIKLLYYNPKYNAMLLQKAAPGISIKYSNMTFKEKAYIYIKTVCRLSDNKIFSKSFNSMFNWLEAIDKFDNSIVGSEGIIIAQKIISLIKKDIKNHYLCHGDLHLDNILQHGDNWLAIDPKGIMGTKEFEIAAFDIIDNSEIKNEDIESIIFERTKILANISETNHDILLYWFYLRNLIKIQWLIEDGAKADWFIKLSKKIYNIIILNNQIYIN